MDTLWTVENGVALLTLTSLEIVLGIDNIVFIAILAGRLPEGERDRARKLGISLAVGTRILLLLSIGWMMGLTTPVLTILGVALTGRDLVLVGGGLFLIYKATHEIHDKIEGSRRIIGEPSSTSPSRAPMASTFAWVLVQILLIDLVFSLDSVITAVGMARSQVIMILAIIASAVVMVVASGYIVRFIERHPTIKMLALSFLLLIGFVLVLDGLHRHVDKSLVYFAMGFSLFVEFINIRIRPPSAREPSEPLPQIRLEPGTSA